MVGARWHPLTPLRTTVACTSSRTHTPDAHANGESGRPGARVHNGAKQAAQRDDWQEAGMSE